MENQERQSSVFGLQFDQSSLSSIRTMASWAMIIVVSTVIRLVIDYISYFKDRAAANTTIYDSGEYTFRTTERNPLPQLIISTIIWILLCFFLYQFSIFTKKGLDNHSQSDLNNGFANLKNYFMTLGIVAIIVVAIVVIVVLFVSVFAGTR